MLQCRWVVYKVAYIKIWLCWKICLNAICKFTTPISNNNITQKHLHSTKPTSIQLIHPIHLSFPSPRLLPGFPYHQLLRCLIGRSIHLCHLIAMDGWMVGTSWGGCFNAKWGFCFFITCLMPLALRMLVFNRILGMKTTTPHLQWQTQNQILLSFPELSLPNDSTNTMKTFRDSANRGVCSN